MNYLSLGQFTGKTYQTSLFDGVTATETEYTYNFIDWHYHEVPYFSLTTFGNCRESNKRETLDVSPDSLLFHNCQEPHCNTKSDSITRGFQVELSLDWCRRFDIGLNRLPKSSKITNPNAKLLFYNIYKESKLSDDTSNLTIDSLLLQTFEVMHGIESISTSAKPYWVKKIEEILNDNFDQVPSLQDLSDELNLHFAHLSRDFSRYFRCNFSEYIRKIRVEKSISLLRSKKYNLTDVAVMCGFSDQSHFIRCFKEFYGITPKKFRSLIS